MRHLCAALLLAAALASVLPGSEARFLLQSSPAATCSLDPSTQLSLTEVTTACVAPATSSNPPRAFCDACSCALFSAFSPALKAAGVTNASDAQAAAKGVSVVASCINNFLGQFVAAKVDINALVALSACQYKEGEVPACLPARVAALTSGAPAAAPSTQPPVKSAGGPSDYQPDTTAPTDVSNVINGNVPAATTVPIGSGAPATTPAVITPTPTPATTPTTTPTPAPVSAPGPSNAAGLATSSIFQIATALLGALMLLGIAC